MSGKKKRIKVALKMFTYGDHLFPFISIVLEDGRGWCHVLVLFLLPSQILVEIGY